MTRPQTLLMKIFVRTALVITLALAILFVPNLAIFDEKLSPEIIRQLDHRANPEIAGNAFYSFYGLAADTNKDPDTVGRTLIQTLQTKNPKTEQRNLTEQETLDIFGGNQFDKDWETIYSAVNCSPREKIDCFNQLLTQLNSQPLNALTLNSSQLKNERLLAQLKRYKKMTQLPHFTEDTQNLDFSSPLPSYNIALHLNRFNQADIYSQSGLNGLITSSQIDMKFWRMLLSESQTVLGAMVGVNALRGDLLSLSYAITKESSLTPQQIEDLQTLLKSLSPEDIKMDAQLTSELRGIVENNALLLKQISEGKPWFISYLTQPTASVNLFYAQTLKPAVAFSQMSATEFYDRAQAPLRPAEFSQFNPYNLGGKIELSRNWQLAAYQGRVHDLTGIYSLVALQVELKATPEQNWSATIISSRFNNPYTKKPFAFDAATKTLSFQCFDAKDTCKIIL